ncbi:MAG TPA: hypothetical protein VGY54_22600 [Polyangiaceae bacterium]|nr:hypothetical protein [Polyangiaceae bacterium]
MGRRHNGRHEAAAVAFALLFGQLASLLHLAIAPHAICLEHGEIIELARAAATSIILPDRGGASAVTAGDAAEHDHDLCLAASADNDAANIIAPIALSPRGGATRAPLPIAATSSTMAARLYRLAPKTSPPA